MAVSGEHGGVALIGGAAGGIGAATAIALADRGWPVLLTDVAEDGLAALEQRITSAGGQALSAVADAREEQDVERVIAAGVERFGGLAAISANAAVAFPEAPLERTSDRVVQTLLDVNVRGTINLLRAALPHLRDGGAIVLTSSTSGLIAHPGAAVYAATKSALIGLGRCLAMELADRRIRVNTICPGGVETELTRGIYGDLQAAADDYARLNPLGRIAQPEDIADAIAFLVGSDARHITGVVLRVDGGDGLHGVL